MRDIYRERESFRKQCITSYSLDRRDTNNSDDICEGDNDGNEVDDGDDDGDDDNDVTGGVDDNDDNTATRMTLTAQLR